MYTNVDPQHSLTPKEVLTQHQVLQLVKLGRTQLWQLRKRGQFPEPLRYPTAGTEKRPRLRWLAADVHAWLEKCRPAAATVPVHLSELHFLGAPSRSATMTTQGGVA